MAEEVSHLSEKAMKQRLRHGTFFAVHLHAAILCLALLLHTAAVGHHLRQYRKGF